MWEREAAAIFAAAAADGMAPLEMTAVAAAAAGMAAAVATGEEEATAAAVAAVTAVAAGVTAAAAAVTAVAVAAIEHLLFFRQRAAAPGAEYHCGRWLWLRGGAARHKGLLNKVLYNYSMQGSRIHQSMKRHTAIQRARAAKRTPPLRLEGSTHLARKLATWALGS